MKALSNHICIVIFTLSALFSCKSTSEESSNPEDSVNASNEISISKKQFESGGMKLGKLASRPLTTSVSTQGYIDVPPGKRAAVSPFYGGYVQEIEVLLGQEVRKGELLFTLQNPDYLVIQQSYLEVMEQLDYLNLDYQRQQTLASEKIASQKHFKKAESDYRVMQAKSRGLEEQLKLMNISISRLREGALTSTIAIYAPIAGFITEVHTMKSAFINPSEVALEIVNTDHIHLELQVFEKDILLVKENQKINFSVPESGGRTFVGEVHLVGKSVDNEQRTVDVHGHISGEGNNDFIPGMYVDADIEVSSVVAMCLPVSAIVEIGGLNYVLIQTKVEKDVLLFAQQQVSIAHQSDDWVEIENIGDFSGKTVLIEGAFSLIGE